MCLSVPCLTLSARCDDGVHRSSVCHHVPNLLCISVCLLGARMESRDWIPLFLELAGWYPDLVRSRRILLDEVLSTAPRSTWKAIAGGSSTTSHAREYRVANRPLLVWLDLVAVDIVGSADDLRVLHRLWNYARLHQWHRLFSGYLSSVSGISDGSKHVHQKCGRSGSSISSTEHVSRFGNGMGNELARLRLCGFDSSSVSVLQVWGVAAEEVEVRAI